MSHVTNKITHVIDSLKKINLDSQISVITNKIPNYTYLVKNSIKITEVKNKLPNFTINTVCNSCTCYSKR